MLINFQKNALLPILKFAVAQFQFFIESCSSDIELIKQIINLLLHCVSYRFNLSYFEIFSENPREVSIISVFSFP